MKCATTSLPKTYDGRLRLILYEHPLNERIRTLLRLEALFSRFAFFVAQQDAKEHHVALTTLFEIAEVSSRTDLKSDLLKELERQRQTLLQYNGHPHISQQALESALAEIGQTLVNLNQTPAKAGQHFADNAWLNSIRTRATVPGGTCGFDLPAYYAWQQAPLAQRQHDIAKWATPLLPLRDATAIVLRLARESSQGAKVIATQGCYQQTLSGRTYQLMQVRIASELHVIPEASASKYMLWVRFTEQDEDNWPRPATADIPFQLTLCNL